MNATVNVPSVDEISTNKLFPLGTEYTAPNGNTYRYVQAEETISTTANPLALGIDEDEKASILSGAIALTGHRLGWAPQAAVADEKYFWARVRGEFPIRVAASTAADVTLGLATTGGRLAAAPTTLSAGNAVILGVTITAAASASASLGNSVRTAIVTFPLAKPPTV